MVTTSVSRTVLKPSEVLLSIKCFCDSSLNEIPCFPANPEEFEDATDQFSFKKMLPRDERRFKAADLNGDLAAEREEFTAFLHPEEFDHMQEIVVLVSVSWILDGVTCCQFNNTYYLKKKIIHHFTIFYQETLEDIDKNGDGHVDEDEYIGRFICIFALWYLVVSFRH